MSYISRSYYTASISEFLVQRNEEVVGQLSLSNEFALDPLQRDAWVGELDVLRSSLNGTNGYILLEYSIPRMGKRVDAIVLCSNVVIVLEFKVGESHYPAHAVDQVFDYALDIKNFHKESHDKVVVPVLVSTEAPERPFYVQRYSDGVLHPMFANKFNLRKTVRQIVDMFEGPRIDPQEWMESVYCPTPTIIEAAQVLYRGHNVQEISRSESGATNLTKTAEAIAEIVDTAKRTSRKAICFVTGVPGAGKTLAGLNIANSWHDAENGQHAVFLSGNGPLVDVLREALARDDVARGKETAQKLTKASAHSRVRAFVQNIHHFRDDAIASDRAPIERVVIFDEAQRAWDVKQTASFMKSKKRIADFDRSEPDFLISVMDRHEDWATIVCLIGGGQEINTGEAGLAEWFKVLREHYRHWSVYVSGALVDSEYADALTPDILQSMESVHEHPDLHLAVSLRSFRAETVSAFVKALLDCRVEEARSLLQTICPNYPVAVTRNIDLAKRWVRDRARGSERYGVIASSEAQRLKPFGVFVKGAIDPCTWFLNGKDDVRSSFYLEDVATEFQIQGLELDWTCVAWDADLRYSGSEWNCFRFRGAGWQRIGKMEDQRYLKNAYRVLLTRARQGMIIFVPEGSSEDLTRDPAYYDHTFDYLRAVGIPAVD